MSPLLSAGANDAIKPPFNDVYINRLKPSSSQAHHSSLQAPITSCELPSKATSTKRLDDSHSIEQMGGHSHPGEQSTHHLQSRYEGQNCGNSRFRSEGGLAANSSNLSWRRPLNASEQLSSQGPDDYSDENCKCTQHDGVECIDFHHQPHHHFHHHHHHHHHQEQLNHPRGHISDESGSGPHSAMADPDDDDDDDDVYDVQLDEQQHFANVCFAFSNYVSEATLEIDRMERHFKRLSKDDVAMLAEPIDRRITKMRDAARVNQRFLDLILVDYVDDMTAAGSTSPSPASNPFRSSSISSDTASPSNSHVGIINESNSRRYSANITAQQKISTTNCHATSAISGDSKDDTLIECHQTCGHQSRQPSDVIAAAGVGVTLNRGGGEGEKRVMECQGSMREAPCALDGVAIEQIVGEVFSGRREKTSSLTCQPEPGGVNRHAIRGDGDYQASATEIRGRDFLTRHQQLQAAADTLDKNSSKVRSTLRQFVRDWSDEGKSERDAAYGPLLEALEARYPPAEYCNTPNKTPPRVLCPGSGLGRLAFEVVSRGYACQGNEFSHFMLLGSNLILNTRIVPRSCTIQPFCLSTSNRRNGIDHLREVRIPDVCPVDVIAVGHDFSMCAGEFVEVYWPQVKEWDAVLTCFFIDTAKNVILYIRTIARILKPGALWANIGPLLYHYAEMPHELSIELPWDEIKKVVETYFVLKKEEWREALYTTNSRSMMQVLYHCIYFIAIRNDIEVTGFSNPVY